MTEIGTVYTACILCMHIFQQITNDSIDFHLLHKLYQIILIHFRYFVLTRIGCIYIADLSNKWHAGRVIIWLYDEETDQVVSFFDSEASSPNATATATDPSCNLTIASRTSNYCTRVPANAYRMPFEDLFGELPMIRSTLAFS